MNIREDIERTAVEARRRGAVVDIGYRLLIISIRTTTGAEYFFQGEEALRLLAEVEVALLGLDTELDDMDVLLWLSRER